MIYEHRFVVHAPLKQVADFHADPGSMAKITPPPIFTQVQQAPAAVKDGAEMAFTLWLGPFPLRWLARFEQVSPTGFQDRQIRGPFATWLHRHTFRKIDENTTEVHDHVEGQYQANLFWRLVGMVMWLNLPVLFAFRGWRTRQLLQR